MEPNPHYTSKDAARDVLTDRLTEIAAEYAGQPRELAAKKLIERLNKPDSVVAAIAAAILFVTDH